MLRRQGVARLLPLLALATLELRPCLSALNIGEFAGEDLVARLRRSIFVETAYLEERHDEPCSSLDGPTCLAELFASGGAGARTAAVRAAAAHANFGVIPERLLRDLGVLDSDVAFVTPEYDILEVFRRQHEAMAEQEALPLLAGDEALATLRDARAGVERGILHFANLRPDSRVPLTFSRNLPSGIVATWDGKWLVRDCSATFVRGRLAGGTEVTLALPPPAQSGEDPHAPALPALWQPPAPAGAVVSGNVASTGSTVVSVVAELTNSVGYLRFSKPVVLHSLFARWRPPAGAPPAVVGGRLGLQGVWTTHLDPKKLRDVPGWVDISGDSLQPVDEVAFVATKGLEIGALEVVAHAGEDEERSVLLLVPMASSADGAKGEAAPKFTLKAQRINGAAAPYIASLQEVIDRNLRLRALPPPRAAGQPRGAHVPGLLASGSAPLQLDKDNITWAAVAATNQAIFEHRTLTSLILGAPIPGIAVPSTTTPSGFQTGLASLLDPDGALPADLRKLLPAERSAILEALRGWLGGGGGWHRSTPSTLPQNGSEEAMLRYTTAKRWQTKLDMLTAVLLHQRTQTEEDSVRQSTSQGRPAAKPAAKKGKK